MTSKKNILTATILLMAVTSWAQQDQPAHSEYLYDDATQLWRLTDNAAGLGIDSTRNRGFAQIGYDHQSGDYARVQEGTRTNQLRLSTERYQKIGRFLYAYGRFDFDYGRIGNRAWCDVHRPYLSDPYFPGSAIAGKYDFQDFDFIAALGTKDFRGFHFGMRLDYKVGDLSRLRDPRSRSLTLEYKLTPSVTYTFGKNTIGLSGNYHRRKEKIVGVKTLQSDAIITYYVMSGMENATGTVGGYAGYSREWVDHRFGAELTYGYKGTDFQTLLAATIERGAENIYGQYKYEQGKFVDYRYVFSAKNRLQSGNLLHELDFQIGYRQSYADEYSQKYMVEHDKDLQTYDYTYPVRQPDGTITYVTETKTKTSDYTSYYYINQLTFKKRYQVKVFDTDLHYRLNFLGDKNIRGYVGTRFAAGNAKALHLLPESDMKYDHYNISLEGGGGLLKNRLWIDAGVTRHINGKAELNLNDPTGDFAQQVLIPDMEYYRANYWQGRLEVMYQQPITIKKQHTLWFAKLYGSYLKTDNSLKGQTAGVAVGLYY